MRLFTFALLLFSITCAAQNMQGVVTDANTGKSLYPVVVVNMVTQQAVSTDENGLYSIPANQGDVIAFSYIGYLTVEKTKPISVIIANVNVVMEPAAYKLPEFRINSRNLTQYQLDSEERMSIYKVPLQRTHPSPIRSPASALAEVFSKRAKTIYKFQKNFQEGEWEKFIDTRYTPDLVTQLTGLTGDSIGHFMYACPMPFDFARTATDLELKMWIRSNFKQWSKLIALDSANKHD